MVIVRGGGVTWRDGKALNKEKLQKIVRAYLSIESVNPKYTVCFYWSRQHNGIHANIKTGQSQDVSKIIISLAACNKYVTSPYLFFVDLLWYSNKDKFIWDYATISLETPELLDPKGSSVSLSYMWVRVLARRILFLIWQEYLRWIRFVSCKCVVRLRKDNVHFIEAESFTDSRWEDTQQNRCWQEATTCLITCDDASDGSPDNTWITRPYSWSCCRYLHISCSHIVMHTKLNVVCAIIGQCYCGCSTCIGDRDAQLQNRPHLDFAHRYMAVEDHAIAWL